MLIADDTTARQRRRAARRPRRAIYDNDAGEVLLATGQTMDELLQVRAVPALKAGLDSVVYNTTFSLGYYLHDTRVGQRVDRPHPKAGAASALPRFAAEGVDPLRAMVDFCADNGTELFAGLRVNDIHDSGYYGYGMISDLKWAMATGQRESWLFGGLRHDPDAGAAFKAKAPEHFAPHLIDAYNDYTPDPVPTATKQWSGFDFDVPEVRRLVVDSAAELAGYGVAGVMLDFQRHPPYFKTVAWGEPITPEQTGKMTEIIRQTRQRLDEAAAVAGRPKLLVVKVMGSEAINLSHGLDVRAWLAEGLIDVLVAGWNYEAPFEPMIALGRRFGVPVYPQIYRGARGGPPVELACAANAWRAGADGLFLFNYLHHDAGMPPGGWWPLLRQMADRDQLMRADKLYVTSPLGYGGLGKYGGHVKDLWEMPALGGVRPATIEPGQSLVVDPFPVADRGDAQDPDRPHAELIVACDPPERGSELTLWFNSHEAAVPGAGPDQPCRVPIPAGWLDRPAHRIELALGPDAAEPVRVGDVQLSVSYQ